MPTLKRLLEEVEKHPIEEVGRRLRRIIFGEDGKNA